MEKINAKIQGKWYCSFCKSYMTPSNVSKHNNTKKHLNKYSEFFKIEKPSYCGDIRTLNNEINKKYSLSNIL